MEILGEATASFASLWLRAWFDRHIKHMVRYQGMQSGLPVFLVGEFDAVEIFMQNDRFAKPIRLSYFSNSKRQNTSYLDRI